MILGVPILMHFRVNGLLSYVYKKRLILGLTGELSIEKVNGSAAKVPSKTVNELETAKY